MNQGSGVLRLGATEFKRRFGNLFRSIFCGTAALRSSFSNNSWAAVFLPTGLNLGEQEFGALVSGASVVGDRELILTDLASLPPHELSSIVSYDRRCFEEARVSGILGAVPAAVFGSSGKWGTISDPEYTVIAGERLFMDRFMQNAGGPASLRKNFQHYLEHDAWLSEKRKQELQTELGP